MKTEKKKKALTHSSFWFARAATQTKSEIEINSKV